jgi:hypothetical protein
MASLVSILRLRAPLFAVGESPDTKGLSDQPVAKPSSVCSKPGLTTNSPISEAGTGASAPVGRATQKALQAENRATAMEGKRDFI